MSENVDVTNETNNNEIGTCNNDNKEVAAIEHASEDPGQNEPETTGPSIMEQIELMDQASAEDGLSIMKMTGDLTGVYVLTFDSRRSLNDNFLDRLTEVLSDLKDSDDIRTMILRTPSRRSDGPETDDDVVLDARFKYTLKRIRSIMMDIYEFPVPVIAAIDGEAIGGGLDYSLGADIRVASTGAKLGLPEARLGMLAGAGATQLLPRQIPVHKAKELIYTGKIISGREAHEYGLLNYCSQENQDANSALLNALGN